MLADIQHVNSDKLVDGDGAAALRISFEALPTVKDQNRGQELAAQKGRSDGADRGAVLRLGAKRASKSRKCFTPVSFASRAGRFRPQPFAA